MFKILIKDTTREERERIVLDSLEYSDVGCGSGSTLQKYLPYINGEKELREINEQDTGKYCVESDKMEGRKGCSR